MSTDHIRMLCDISELSGLFVDGKDTTGFLNRIVVMVADHMDADVCSIYLYDESSDDLVLTATKGLNPDQVQRLRLAAGEGIVGAAFQEGVPVHEKKGSHHPRFKYVPGLDEDDYDAFIAVPVLLGVMRVGVLTLQRKKGKSFRKADILALRAISSQLASIIQNARILMSLDNRQEKKARPVKDISFVKGKSATGGFAYAPVYIPTSGSLLSLSTLPEFQKVYTLQQFERAIDATEKELEELQERVEERLDDAASLIFAAHLLMLRDKSYTGGMRKLVEEGTNPPEAVLAVYHRFRSLFTDSENQLIREKVQDIEDLAKRILSNLILDSGEYEQYNGRVIISSEVYPSDLLRMSADDIQGLVLVGGGVTSHISILARSLHIPLVIADEPELVTVPNGSMLLLDGDLGNIYINPAEDIVKTFEERNEARKRLLEDTELLSGPGRTADGEPVRLMVNVNLLTDVSAKEVDYIDGVGLYRTEFPFMIRNDFPSEEEQFVIYRKLVDRLKGKPVTFRTLDIGGDKLLSYYESVKEQNPFLGMRSLRFSLTHTGLFREQIRAILRAGSGNPIRIMFPMVSSMEDYLQARELVYQSMEELKTEGMEFNDSPSLGIMVELPSAVFILEDLAEEVDFLSVGTNDLIQYTLAVDRTNDTVAHLYVPHHPAVLRSLARIAEVARAREIDVSICGDMGGRPEYVPFLLGIGVRTLSVDALYIPRVKRALKNITMEKAEETARAMLSLSKMADIKSIIETFIEEE